MNPASSKALLLVSLLGLASLLATLYGAWQWEKAYAQSAFEKTSGERRALIQRAVDTNLETLYAVRGLFNSSLQVERSEFAAFVSESLTRHPEIASLEWRPRISDAQRSRFEKAARADGAPQFAIQEFDATGQKKPAERRDYYFPVLFAEPLSSSTSRLGLNISAEAEAGFGANRAALSNDLYAERLARLEGPACAGDTSSVCLYLPVYFHDATTADAAHLRDRLGGFIVMGLRLDRLLANSVGAFASPAVAIQFPDDQSKNAPAWLSYTPLPAADRPVTADLVWSSSIHLGHRSFPAVFSSEKDQFGGRPWPLGLIFVAGLLSFALSGGYLWATQISRSRIGRLVSELKQEALARGAATERLIQHEQRLQKQNAALVDLVRRKTATVADESHAFATITELACSTLGVARAGVWLYTPDRMALGCVDLFHLEDKSHWAEQRVQRSDCPNYFAAIERERVLAAHDATNDSRTAELAGGYLRPLGIGAMLDAPIIRGGVTSGVLCCEHIGAPRIWDATEEAFAGSLAEYIALELEARERRSVDQQRNNLATIIEALPDSVAIATADRRISYFNKAYGQLLGIPDQVPGQVQSLDELYPEKTRWQFVEKILPTAMDAGFWVGETELLIGGEAVPVHQTLIVHRDRQQQVRFLSTLLRDLRAEKAAEAAAFERERFLSALLANLPGVVYRRRNAPGWPMEYISAGCLELTGYSAEHILAETPRYGSLINPEDLPRVQAEIESALRDHRFFELEYRITRADGREVWLWTKGHGLYGEDGSLLAREAFIGDVTERIEAQHKLQQLNAELEERIAERTARLREVNQNLESFAYSVSHDLKAPLRGIDGYSRLLLEDYRADLPEEAQRFLDTIRSATERMNQLIDDLLAYSRLERRTLNLAPVVLQAALDKVMAEREFEIQQAGAEIRLEVNTATVTADQDGLMLILRNLIDNALKFSRDRSPPVISISAQLQAGKTQLCVADNGCGFDMKYGERIFEIFQRLHRVEEYSGTGIGLAIVRKAAERMGGRVWAESELGQGARFFLELPQ